MGPGHESNLTLQPWDMQDIPFLTLMWSQELWKKIGTQIARYRKSYLSPICTSIVSPQQYYCSLYKVRTYILCKIPTCTEVFPLFFTSFSIQSVPAGPDVGRGLCPLVASRVFATGHCQHGNKKQVVSDLSFFPDHSLWHMLWELLTQTCSPPFCVCAVKFNQDGICCCLMWVIVLYGVRVHA